MCIANVPHNVYYQKNHSLLCYEFCQGSDYVWPTMAILCVLCKLTVQEKLFFSIVILSTRFAAISSFFIEISTYFTSA